MLLLGAGQEMEDSCLPLAAGQGIRRSCLLAASNQEIRELQKTVVQQTTSELVYLQQDVNI
jgi:hypothetical protein